MTKETAKKIIALNAQTYNRIAHAFSNTRTRSWDEFIPLTEFLKEGMSILDIGCGNGRLLTAFPKYFKLKYTGIDMSTKLIQEAQRIHKEDFCRPEFLAGDILSSQEIPEIRGKQYDVVSAIAVLNHIPSRELQMQALSTMRTFLKPGGILFLTNWNLLQIGARKSVWRYKWKQFCISDRVWHIAYGFSKKELGFRDIITIWKSGRLSEPLYYYSFNVSELARLCAGAGFRVQEVYYSNKGKRVHWWDGRNSVVVAVRV